MISEIKTAHFSAAIFRQKYSIDVIAHSGAHWVQTVLETLIVPLYSVKTR